MENVLIETERMTIRRFTMEDFGTASVFLKDPEVMYAWEHGFSDEEVTEWLEKNMARYQKHGYGWLRADDKQTGENVGTLGIIYNEDINGEAGWELGYIINKSFWGKGYAAEGAAACAKYILEEIGAPKVFSQMRVTNEGSRAVAEKIGMKHIGTYDRFYCGKTMPHHIYAEENQNV